jgi:hypothetical protein
VDVRLRRQIMQRTLRYILEIGGLPLPQRLAKLFTMCVECAHAA